MTIEEYNNITGLREQGKSWKEVHEAIGAKESYLTIKNRYNKEKKKNEKPKDTINHTPIIKEEIQLVEKNEPKEVIHHNPFSMDDLGILKNIIADYKEKQEGHLEIYDWSLPAEYRKIKNTQVSIRLNKTLFDDLKKEVSKIDSDIKVAEVINKAMSDLLLNIK